MKLFTRYNRVNITATILTFIAGSIAFYFVIDYVLTDQLDRNLRTEQQEIQEYTQKNNQLPEINNTKQQWIDISEVKEPKTDAKPFYTNAYNSIEKEKEEVRQIAFTVHAENKFYRVTVSQSKTETEDLLGVIIFVTVGMIALMLFVNYFVNRRLITTLWKPFYKTIDSIRDHKLSAGKPLFLAKTTIDEIDLLNESLNKMAERIHGDYLALKTFTENASHEMQTPLAVIRSKVEALLQETEGKEKMWQQLLSIEDAALKLSRLHQSLLLLTKLENRQFPLTEKISLKAIIQQKLSEREELISARQLTVNSSLDDVVLQFHPHLAEILVNNLLNNVIRYTPENGTVVIALTSESLSIRNTATGGSLDTGKIFQRFYKEEQSAENTGLGLAIVKEICQLACFTISYSYSDNQHDFTVCFQGASESLQNA